MKHLNDLKRTRLASAEESQQRIKEDWKKFSEHWGASEAALTEGENGLLFHLEFDDEEKFSKFAGYLKAQGLLGEDEIPCDSKKVH
jgi:hypothetical protein